MPKNLTTEMTAELVKTVKRPVIFVHLDLNDLPLRFWSGAGVLEWGGQTWLGSGDLGHIDEIPSAVGVEANSMRFQLRGVVLENVSLALENELKKKTVNLWIGFMTADDQLIADPYLAFVGSVDTAEIAEDGNSVDIGINVESRATQIFGQKERRRTHEDQQIDFPGDMGLEFVAELQDGTFEWG